MKISKQARRDAKALFRSCRENGRLDEAKVREVTANMLATRPRRYLAILTHFQRLLKLHLDSRRVRVENAVPTPPEMRASLQSALERRYGSGLEYHYEVNPALLGGLRIRVGSDVYDGSVEARLEELKTAF
jgi:F-type H+-transporting ATPase subunit delta